jgi:hypothetical protein
MEIVTVPLGRSRRIFARPPRRNLGRLVPWTLAILCAAGVSAAAGAILAVNATHRVATPQEQASKAPY